MKNLLVASFLIVLSFSSAFGQAGDETPFVDGQYIVMFSKGVRPQQLLRDFGEWKGKKSGLILSSELSDGAGIYLFEADTRMVNQFELLEEIRRKPYVLAAQFNHYVKERLVPTDPQFGSQWHHLQASDKDIDSDLAWNTTTGGNTALGHAVVACVVEPGGINWSHPDLLANHWVNLNEIAGNGIDDDGNGRIDDVNGWNAASNNGTIPSAAHGTGVSGMIGAVANNGNGGVGVCWDVKLMPVVMSSSLTEANVIAAYDYAYDMRVLFNSTNGALGALVVVVNSSWGIDNANPVNYPVWCAFYDTMGAAGILNCAATANNNVNIDVVGDMPTGCSSPYLISVTATNSSDVRTFSGYGINSIDLAAPGASVWLPNTSSYQSWSGTSFASPCVAGAVSLLYSAPCSNLAALALSSPATAAVMVRDAIFNGVDLVPNLAAEVATGGRLNVNNALNILLNNCGTPPVPGCTNAAACNFNPAATLNDGSCTYPGCNNPLACNYNPAAGCDDGSCEGTATTYYLDADHDGYGNPNVFITQCTAPCNGVYTIFINSNNYWIDETTWTFKDASNTTIASGGPYGFGGTYTVNVSSNNGPFTFFIETQGLYNDNFPSWSVSSGTGLLLASGNTTGGSTYTINGIDCSYVTNNNDCNDNNPLITSVPEDPCNGIDDDCDGLIDEGRVDGCTIQTACNYNPLATCNTVACTYPGCTDPSANNFNPAAGCSDGSCTYNVPGCTDPQACNYNPAANVNDGSCTYPGCTNPQAANYNPLAGCDDGSCQLNTCAGDFDFNGVINVADLLTFMSQFGCLANCGVFDFNNDQVVTVTDLLLFMSWFGTICP